MRRSIAAIALLATAWCGSGCTGPASEVIKSTEGTPGRISAAFVDRKADDAPYSFHIEGPAGLDVELFNGSVSVVVDPELEETTLTFTRGASHGYNRKEEAEVALDEIHYSFDIVPGTLGQVLQVRATTDSTEPHYLRMDVEIETPALENVHIRTGKGDVEVMNGTGTVDIETVRGDVRYLTMTPVHQSIRMISGRGNVDLRVRGESTGAILAEALRGEVRHRVTRGRWIVKEGTSFNRVLASLNDGRNPIEIRTYEGTVRFASVRDPLAVGAFIVD